MNIIINTNMVVTLFRNLSHVIIMAQKSISRHRVKGLGFNKGKFYQSDK